MRRTRTIVILILALSSGGLAAYATLRLLRERTAPLITEQAPSSTQVVVAARELAIGELLSDADVKLVNWPGNTVPAGYARSIADVVGRGITTRVALNEPLLDSKLADRGQGGLTITIPEGMRAMGLRVDEVIGVAGFITPQTRFDVLLTVEDSQNSGATDRSVTKVVLQNIQALAAGTRIERDPEGKPLNTTVLTVLVTPEDAEKLALAQSKGRIQLALRNMIDVRDVRTDGARLSELLTGLNATTRRTTPARTGAPAATTPQSSAATVEVIKGGTRALIRF